MSKVFTQQAVVRVWRNVKTMGYMPTSHFGHAAVTIKGSMVPGFKQHISFWPGDYASKGNATKKQDGDWTNKVGEDKRNEMGLPTALRLEVGYCQTHGIPYPDEYNDYLAELNKGPITAPRPGQKRLGLTNSDGLPLWSQSAEAKIPLPGIGCKERLWGLSVRRMGLWWLQFKTTAPYYQALGKQNCAGVALMGLSEGGSEAFVECPGITVYGEPVQVEKYAKELELQLERMDAWSEQLDADIRKGVMSGVVSSSPNDQLKDGLWTVDVWKQKSALGTFQMRSSTVREMDSALEKYHAADWGAKFTERYKALVKLFLAIVKHRQDKADSARSEAVLRLGSQILTIVRNPGPIW